MNHFKNAVPVAIQTKILSVAELALDDFINNQNDGVSIDCDTLEEISGNSYDGYIAFQDGGYTMTATYRCDTDSSYHLTQKQTDCVRGQDKDCFDTFLSDNDLETSLEYDNLTKEQQEKLSEYESDWFEYGALLTLNIYASATDSYLGNNKEKTVTVNLLLNYRDAEYGRDKYAESIYTKVYSFDKFLLLENKKIIADINY